MPSEEKILLISITDSGRECLTNLLKKIGGYQVVEVVEQNVENLTKNALEQNLKRAYEKLNGDLFQILIVVDRRIEKNVVKVYQALIEKFYNSKIDRSVIFKKVKIHRIDKNIAKLTTFVRTKFDGEEQDMREDIDDLKDPKVGKNVSGLITSLSEEGGGFVYISGVRSDFAQESEKEGYEKEEGEDKQKLLNRLKAVRDDKEKKEHSSLQLSTKKDESLKAAIELIKSELKIK